MNLKPNAHNLIVVTLMVAIGFAIIAAARRTPAANWPIIGSFLNFITRANQG